MASLLASARKARQMVGEMNREEKLFWERQARLRIVAGAAALALTSGCTTLPKADPVSSQLGQKWNTVGEGLQSIKADLLTAKENVE